MNFRTQSYSTFNVQAIVMYRYGFNGMEADDELQGSYTTEFRQYDPRTGRWYSVDPLGKESPWQTPYNGMDNKPIIRNDINGDCPTCLTGAVVGAIIELVFQVGEHMLVGDKFLPALKKTDWIDIGIAAVSGAATGVFTGGVDKLAKIVSDPKKAKVLKLVMEYALDLVMSKVEEELGESVDRGKIYATVQKATGMNFGTPSMNLGISKQEIGAAGEEFTAGYKRAEYGNGYTVLEQVEGTFVSDGKKTIMDVVVVDNKTGKIVEVIESKATSKDVDVNNSLTSGQRRNILHGEQVKITRGNGIDIIKQKTFNSANIKRSIFHVKVSSKDASKILQIAKEFIKPIK